MELTAPAGERMGTEILDDLEIQDRIREKREATLYHAHQRSRNRAVALKVVGEALQGDAEFLDRYRRDADLLSQVHDGHIVQVLGTGTWRGRLFCASEWVEGEDLGRQLERGYKFTTEEILHIAQGVAHALRSAWKHQIVHRGIKPSNIFLTPDGTVKVADFGLAKAPGGTEVSPRAMAYLSPEQAQGLAVDIRSDVYSVGAVLYELATGKPPFEGYDSVTSLLYQIVHVQPPSPREMGSSIPREVDRVILRCLAKTPEDRYQTPADLMADLREVKASLSSAQVTSVQAEDDSGDFDIYEDQVIGEGGMGTLYRGRQRSLDRGVAVKVIREAYTSSPEFIQRFRREAELLAQVNHPNVVQVYGTGTWKRRIFYAMELVRGTDLASRQKRGHRCSVDEILHVAQGVANALQAAWKYKIVHRDIKPSNILITPDGTVKVADFGLAKSLRIPASESQIIAGTAEYLSPEQGVGQQVDIRSDIYSLGVVLYELTAGRTPFPWAGSSIQVIYQHVHAQPPPLREFDASIPEPLQLLIHRCLAKKPEDRFQTPDEVLDAIRGILRRTRSLQMPRLREGRGTRWKIAAAAAGALLIAGGAFLAVGLGGRSRASVPGQEAYDLAMGLGQYEEARRLAESSFGASSAEARKAALLAQMRELEATDARARAARAARDWSGAAAAYRELIARAIPERQQALQAGLRYCEDLEEAARREGRGDWSGALAIYRKYEAHPVGDVEFIRASIERVLARGR
jgi:serine/threonine protein kinase